MKYFNKRFLHTLALLVILVNQLQPSSAQRRRTCELNSEIKYLELDETGKSFKFANDNSANNTVQARACNCGRGTSNEYCLIYNNENHCSTRDGGETRCFHLTMFYALKQMFWTPVYFSILILFMALFTTQCGKFARNYALGKCLPCWVEQINQRMINRVLQRERQAREGFRRAWEEARNRPDGMREQIYLKFKTKTLNTASANKSPASSPTSHGTSTTATSVENNEKKDSAYETKASEKELEDGMSEDDGELMCSICMVEFEDGERVSDLQCGHQFHVECLKTWVLWRNTCPLCNAPDIAQTHTKLVPREDANTDENGGMDERFSEDNGIGNPFSTGNTTRAPLGGSRLIFTRLFRGSRTREDL